MLSLQRFKQKSQKEAQMIKDNKLIALLKTLTPREIKRLDDFVHSPFFNKKERVMALFKILKEQYPKFENLHKAKLYLHIFSENTSGKLTDLNKKQDKQLRDVMSDLVNLIQEFLLYEEGKQNKVREKRQLAEIFMNRGLISYVPEAIKAAQKNQTQRPEGEPANMHDKYELSETELGYRLVTKPEKEVGMQTAINNFHYYALAGQLSLYVAAMSREQIVRSEYNYWMMNELIEHFSKHDYAHVPIVDVYYRIFMMFRGEEVNSHYTNARKVLKEKKEYFPYSELENLYGLLLNFCNIQINKGDLSYNMEKFIIYEETFADKLWYSGRYISYNHFILAVRAALGVGNIEGAEAMINQYSKDIHPKHQKAITCLARAFWLITQKKFAEAEDLLIGIDIPRGFYYSIYFRQLLMQIYHELSISEGKHYIESLKREIDNLNAYLRSDRMSKRNKDLYTNYSKILQRIYNMRFKRVNAPSDKVLEKIKTDIENREYLLIARAWLFEKIEEVIEYWRDKR